MYYGFSLGLLCNHTCTLTDQEDSICMFEALPGAVQKELTPETVSVQQLQYYRMVS